MQNAQTLTSYLEFARDLARAAGEITLRYFRRQVSVEIKRDASPVTIADRETEQLIREQVMRTYPEHGILGEEFGTHQPEASHQWIIDPIDGTKAFITGVPLYTVLIALVIEGEPRVGIIYNPFLDELCSAATGLGCTLNGVPCRVSSTTDLADAKVHCTDYGDLLHYWPTFGPNLLRSGRFARTWADAYGYLLVASGRADVMLDPVMHPWDMAALIPIINEAGGRMTALDGQPASGPAGMAHSSLATNGRLHDAVLDLHHA